MDDGRKFTFIPWNGGLAATEIVPGSPQKPLPYEFTVFGEIRKRRGRHIVLGRPRAPATGTIGRRLRIIFQQKLVSLAEALNCVDDKHTFGLSKPICYHYPGGMGRARLCYCMCES
ncbi:hypothetical protein MVEN_02611100 [Mycena venus]|uniref:Uncharacterized protein n=1 Tax=Mycena venus TaxID=2733690 RepID=A0A8H6U2Z1_9AGAR|nr:hypothetical protein MVEN_02611100 [Mycena venus]